MASDLHSDAVWLTGDEDDGDGYHEERMMPFDLNEPAGNMIDIPDLNLEPDDIHHQAHEYIHHQPSSPTDLEHQPEENSHHKPTRKRLSTEEKMQILLWILNKATEGQLQYGTINAAAHEFGVTRRCISTIWNTAKNQRETQQRYSITTKFHNSGRKRIEVPTEQIKSIKMGDRSCIRDLASKLNISKSSVHRMVKRGSIRPHTNPLHPGLTDPNKITRLQWILSLLQGDTAESKSHYYPMYDFVHLDEKWFFLSKKSHRVYLAENEKGKYRSASSSKFIPKVMFTAAVARPRFNAQGECTFDDKIGIFPFTYLEPAKRKSKNREKGTMVTKLVESINRKETRSMLINNIIPAIKSKWPQDGSPKTIFIQQDNAKAHIQQHDAEWQVVHQQDGFTFILVQQPPNSPDLNILDLGFFRSIQSLMHKKMPKNIEDMIEAYYELDPKTLSYVWITMQYVMDEVLKVNGGNEFDLPHISKRKLESQGNLDPIVKAPTWAVLQAWNTINGGHPNGMQETQEEDTQVIIEVQSIQHAQEAASTSYPVRD